MIKKITTILNSPLGYKYKCVFIYNYIDTTDNPINGTFYIGDPKTKPEEACVTISVFYPSNDNRFVDSSIATLILVKYYKTCAENKDLVQGEGTVDMINTSLTFVKRMCPFIKEFKLNDASTKRCDNGSIISLPYFYMTQKEMTWYEGRFKAYLKEPYYTAYKNDISHVMNTHLPQFELFSVLYLKNISSSIINELKTIYIEGDTLKQYFSKLYAKYNAKMGCILLQPWIDTFMTIVGLQKYVSMADWYISSSTISTYTFPRNKNNMYKINTRKRHPWNK